jgi:CheY-like chemotaxis protein
VGEPGTSARILVVDDEVNVRILLERVLGRAGYTTALASDGQAALAVAATFSPFSLLLTDLKMPQMGGEELARRLRQTMPTLKVLYLTSYADQLFDIKGGRLWEDEAFLEKPASPQSILEAVSLLLYGRA